MKKILLILALFFCLIPVSEAKSDIDFSFFCIKNCSERDVKALLNSQVKYANKNNFEKFISTYDPNYKNGDGFDLETYSKLVKELWDTYSDIKYGIKIQDIKIDGDKAEVKLVETSSAEIRINKNMGGVLRSKSYSIYYLRKIDNKWKVYSDKIINEDTSMLYGDAVNLDIKLSAPETVDANYEYTASLEFIPPKDTFAIASIAKDKVEYPQKLAKEVFRKMPEDNILERLFISNSDSTNEYIIASIGLTKADIQDLSIKLSLSGFGYKIIRVNVNAPKTEGKNDKN